MLCPKTSRRIFLSLLVFLLLLAFTGRLACQAATLTNFQVLWPFPNTNVVTASPVAPLLEGSDGALYGAAAGYRNLSINGAVFKINKNGSGFTLLQSLGQDLPLGGLIEASNEVLYGTTDSGGAAGLGSVYRINKDGSGYAVIHDFTADLTNGSNPEGALIQGMDGALYGTTYYGGTNINQQGQQGTVFRISLDGSNFTLIHSFTESTNDGANPNAALIVGNDGAFYGTTQYGGDADNGTVFRINADGSAFSILHSFGTNANDGTWPLSDLVIGPGGKLYGTTEQGGLTNNSNGGTVFSLDQNGNNYAVLHSFTNLATDGVAPQSGLVVGPDGAFYGTTKTGGAQGQGTIYKMASDGSSYQVIASLGGTYGTQPYAELLAASNGALYGTASSGGPYAPNGTIFALSSSPLDHSLLANPLSLGGTGWRISGQGVPNRAYTLQTASNMAPPIVWSRLATVTANGAGNWTYNDLTNVPPRFYRTSYP